ncbi:hypothetical protein PENSPDRAFT_680777 [Peniophora sp. CONT]|nr:hypothetical protein PENSPDRAFT_680777 [Peniophora sp. CONT]
MVGVPSKKAPLEAELSLEAAGLQVFAPHRLHDHDAVHLAVEELNAAVLQDNATAVIKAALDHVNPDSHLERDTKALYALPFIISGTPQFLRHTHRLTITFLACSAKAASRLAKEMIDLFPQTRTLWDISFYGWRLLLALLKAAFFLPIEPAVANLHLSAFYDHKHTLCGMARFAALSSQVLLSIPTDGASRLRSNSYAGISSSLLLRYRLPEIPHFPPTPSRDSSGHRRSRREHKRFQDRTMEWWASWIAAHKSNTSAFDELGVLVPSSRAEAHELSCAVLSSCKRMLEALFEYLRRESLKTVIQDVYAPLIADVDTIAWTADNIDAFSTDWGSSVPTVVHASPRNALMDLDDDAQSDEAFPFDDEKEFGPWRIMIEHQARKALREADGKMYDVYRRKIQDLSNGYLYGDNQKKLKGHEHQLVPLYEAKMTRDTRLVYQMHVIPDGDGKNERQGAHRSVLTIYL